ncbi:hypothetical protein Tco_0185676 [Tanacetum coccineum]
MMHEFSAGRSNPSFDSPNAESPEYVTKSDPEEDPEEYEDDETEDGPVDYPMDGGDDRDDDDGDSSRDDANDEDEDDEDEDEEARRSISSANSTYCLLEQVTAELPLPPFNTLPPLVDHRVYSESESPPKRLYLSTLGSRYEVGESSTARPTRGRGIDYGFVSTVDAEERQGIRDVGYGIRDTWVDPGGGSSRDSTYDMGEVNTRVTELAELHEHDTQDLYALLEYAQDSRSCISQRVDMDSQRVDLLMRDRMTLQETVWMVEEEAYASREAWAHSIGLSQATHQELQTHHDHVYAYETHLQAHQTQLQLQSTLIQTQHQALREQQRRARQSGPEARIPDHQDAFGDAAVTSSDLWLFGKIKKLEIELWNLKVKGNDVPAYTERFQELTLIYTKFVSNETEKVDKYISGLPDNIYRNVKSARPKTLDETIELAMSDG